ncbi:uncharacterized protein LOC123864854 [Maniola jurtina]|uniref:uncharacterized protein LOC123864854 n=1 Tax=Maniola jurtina TaxID=191418 RepID=UPI001E68D096|nr:uncharacterized protein LOC123864854 [Maniola jurtina]XP_045761508.1 uncharacterized protein LOC123864854 [Maniola jurtina]XP_045761509.1 uncharacterized protein LOC123864854 [Maniola jurtina]
MKGAVYVMLGTLFEVCKGQYIAINPKPSTLSPCDNFRSTALIERFFDLIFTEFHNTPPACICVQICYQQPTYCYPNGCLKRTERKKMEETTFMVNPIPKANYESTAKSATYGIDHRAIVDDLLERPHLLTLYGDTTEKPKTNDLIHRPNPFKELVLKYKKVPKLEMKYNLREQVKNKNSEKLNKEKNIDISKTRWPSNKHLLHGKSPFHRERNYKKIGDTKQTKFFVSMYPDNDPLSYSPVYYKKLLAKRDNNNGVNVEAMYLYQADTANFTLEALIDNLIESSLDKSKKDTRLRLNIELDEDIDKESMTEANINFADLHFLLDRENETHSTLNNTAVSIISMNSTNEDIDINKYSHDMDATNQNTFSEMIASMSKEIEKQNKASMEFLGRVAGLKKISNKLSTDMILQYNVTATNLNVTENIAEQTNATKIIDVELTTKNINSRENFTTPKPVPVTKSSIYQKLSKGKLKNLYVGS